MGGLADRIVSSGRVYPRLASRSGARVSKKLREDRDDFDDKAISFTKMINYRGFDYYIEIKRNILTEEIYYRNKSKIISSQNSILNL